MTTEQWTAVEEYFGGGEAIHNQVQQLQSAVNVLLHGYRAVRHNRWMDLQEHVKQVNYYSSAHGVDYINELTDEFVAEYGTYDGSADSASQNRA